MDIPLLLLRDILTDWDTSPILNAARAQEARQIYAARDRTFPKRIVPADLGRAISEADPAGTLFFVQQKVVKEPDEYSTPNYAVVWARDDWLNSTECQISKSTAWATEREAMVRRSTTEDRIKRIAARITKILPVYKHILPVLQSLIDNETELRKLCSMLEQHFDAQIYEAPEGVDQNPETGSAPGPASAPVPAPVRQNRFIK